MNYPGVLFAGVELGDATGKHIKLPAGALRQEHGGPLREHRESLMLLLLPHLSLPNYWSFNFSISPSNEYSGLISFRTD